MRTIAGLLLLSAAQATSAGPVDVPTTDGFEMRGWFVLCSSLRHSSPHCSATRTVRRHCLRMSFGRSEAYVEAGPRCDSHAPRLQREVKLPYSFFDWRVSDAFAEILREGGSSNGLDKKAIEDAETVAMLLHKITNEPDAP